MAGSFNKIIIVGYLGREPEVRYLQDATPVCNFSVATTERKKDKSGEYHDQTLWFKVTLWRKLAELAGRYLSKGSQVYIEGRLSQTEYQDRDGVTRTSLEVNATDMKFLGSKNGGGSEQAGERGTRKESAPARREEAPAITEDDVPF